MRKFARLVIGMVVLSFSAACFATARRVPASSAGGMDGGGAGVKLDTMTAWFVETRPVNYCLVVHSDFKASHELMAKNVRAALDKWVSLVQRKGLAAPLATEFVHRQLCTPDVDLTFYIGGQPSEVDAAIRNDPSYFAWSHPVSRNASQSWARGYVYIKSLKASADDYAALLLHELGHVFGTDHIAHTIMDQNIVLLLGSWSREQKHSIDHGYRLLANEEQPVISRKDGSVHATLHFKRLATVPVSYAIELVQEKEGDRQLYRFEPELNIDLSLDANRNFGPALFNSVTYGPEPEQVNFSFGRYEEFVVNGTILHDGQRYAGRYVKNIGKIGHSLDIYWNGQWQNLFFNP